MQNLTFDALGRDRPARLRVVAGEPAGWWPASAGIEPLLGLVQDLAGVDPYGVAHLRT